MKKILIATPAPPKSRKGNRITALRWSRLLEELAYQTEIVQEYTNQSCDLFIAFHGRKSHPSILNFRQKHPKKPIVLLLTGTDLYKDFPRCPLVNQSLEWADKIVTLQAFAIKELPFHIQKKTRVIYQSVQKPSQNFPKYSKFSISIVGHLRSVKDPFLTAKALDLLPTSLDVQVYHFGSPLNLEMETNIRKITQEHANYYWMGDVSQKKVLEVLSKSHLHILSSKMEGGANALCEATALSIPSLCSKIPGNLGILGEEYSGYFTVGDAPELASLLQKSYENSSFYQSLKESVQKKAFLFDPDHERQSLKELVDSLL